MQPQHHAGIPLLGYLFESITRIKSKPNLASLLMSDIIRDQLEFQAIQRREHKELDADAVRAGAVTAPPRCTR